MAWSLDMGVEVIASLCVRFLALWDGKGRDGQWPVLHESCSYIELSGIQEFSV